jgi:hypothetical protein
VSNVALYDRQVPPVTPPVIPQLDAADQDVLTGLVTKLVAHQWRNSLRRKYYDAHTWLHDLGIAIPPSMRDVETVLGWAQKGVDALVNRTAIDGWTSPDGDTGSLGVDDVWSDNHLDSEAVQAHTSAAIHSVAFISVTEGDPGAGEPRALISERSAEYATGTWNPRRRALDNALSIFATDQYGSIRDFALYLPNRVIVARRDGSGWDLRQSVHELGIPVEPLVHRPRLDRPFGSSRISRPAMGLIDAAVRTLLRSEVSAEFFSAPQRYALGVDSEAFTGPDGQPIPAWQAVIGRILALGRDDEGELPQVGQFSQQSMEPHLAHLRLFAAQFASEVNLPIGSLGVAQDNPSSAEAILAAKEDLVIESTNWCRSLSPAWERSMVRALRLIDDSPAARQAYRGLRAHWANPATPSVVSAADAFSKQSTAIPDLASTTVGLELAGLDPDQIRRYQAERRRAAGRATVDQLIAAGQQQPPAQQGGPDGASQDEAQRIKNAADALGVLIRAGVDPADAARRVGLPGVRFTGAVPVNLRMPESQATGLEEK